MEELGIGRPSTYAAVLAVLREREYVRIDKKQLVPEDKGLLVTAFLESFSAATSNTISRPTSRRSSTRSPTTRSTGNRSCAISGGLFRRHRRHQGAAHDRGSRCAERDPRPHIFPPRSGGEPAHLPDLRHRPALAQARALRCLRRLLELSRMPLHAPVHGLGRQRERRASGTRLLGDDPETGLPVTVRDGRFGPFIQRGEAEGDEKPKRASIPRTPPSSVDLDKALKLLALPREVARHPETGQPILANIGRYGCHVQHGKTYATLGRDDDVLEVGGNRAIDLIVAKESGAAGAGRRSDPGRPSAKTRRAAKASSSKPAAASYVTDGSVNATLPREMAPDAVTLDEAVGLLNAGALREGKSKRRAPGRAAERPGQRGGERRKRHRPRRPRRQKSPAAKRSPARKNAAEWASVLAIRPSRSACQLCAQGEIGRRRHEPQEKQSEPSPRPSPGVRRLRPRVAPGSRRPRRPPAQS